ncbi:alpha/beta fold hydrolase [Nocardioides yefusunii]|uniref:Alpha/beta fold hydrolase n=1 Tax=Nocardioides yefusunii TaxID=2500546 RepID=A0ABW1R160_9ACTN|nr:alpha/beta hydrolase [Nocardioides yefusunii]
MVEARGLKFHTQVLTGEPAVDADGNPVKRPKIVMLHGLVIDNLSSWFYTLANPLAAQADVYLMDMRGHGRTTIPDTGYSVEENVQDLLAMLTEWGLDDEPVHFFGNSFGCVVGLTVAQRFPEKIASLFLIEAHFSVPGWGEQMAGSLEMAAFGLDEGAVRAWLDAEADRKMSRLAMRAEKLFFQTSLIADLKAEPSIGWLAEVSRPLYAIYGSESDILDRARELDAEVPDSTLEIVPDSSHALLIENPGLIKARAMAWLNAQAGTTYEIVEVAPKHLGTYGAVERMEQIEQIKAESAQGMARKQAETEAAASAAAVGS